MNNAISRLLEAATAEAPEWFNKLSPEAQERYLSLHPNSSLQGKGGSSEDEKQAPSDDEYDRAFEEHKHGVTEEEKKGQKSTDVVPHGEKRDSDGQFESKKSEEKKTGTDIVRKGKHPDDDVTDVDFKEIPRDSKEKPKLNAPDKKAESPEKESGKESPEKEPSKSKDTSEKAASPKKGTPAPKKAPEKRSEKPSAVDRIKEDEDDEKKNRADRAEERREEKHQHQMDVMRRKEEERQADRAEKKRKAEEKDSEKKPEEKKPAEQKSPEKKPSHKKDDKKSEKKETKKSNGFGENKPSEKSGPSGSRSEPASEQHKPNAMPNENGVPNPNGKDGGSDSAVKRLQDGGGKATPVTPDNTPSKPGQPINPRHAPALPDDTDVNFEDAPNPNAGPKPGQPNPEGEKPGGSSGDFKSESPSAPSPGSPTSDIGPASQSEAPKVEEKPGSESESIDVPEAPGGEVLPQIEQPEGPGESAPAPEGVEPKTPSPSEGIQEPSENAPTPGESAPEAEQPTSEAPAPFEQEQPEAPAPETQSVPESLSPDTAVDRLRDPNETPTGKDGSDISRDEPFSETPEKEDQGQKAPGFSAAPGGMMGQKPGAAGTPSSGPDQGSGQSMQNRGQGVQQQKIDSPNDPFATKAPNLPGSERSMPRPQSEQAPHEQVKETPTAPNSQARSKSAQDIRAQAPNIAQRLMNDTVGVPKGLAAMYNILEGRGTAQDGRAALNLLGTILGTAASMASGPIGVATFMAIKHAGIPAMVEIVKKAFGGSRPTMNPEHQQEDLKHLVESAADYAQAGNIPAQAWQAGVKEAQQQRG